MATLSERMEAVEARIRRAELHDADCIFLITVLDSDVETLPCDCWLSEDPE